MLKWIILAAFVAGLTVGTMTGVGSSSKTRGCLPAPADNSSSENTDSTSTNSSGENAQSGDTGSENSGDAASNANSSDTNTNASAGANANSNSSAENANANGDTSNSNENVVSGPTIAADFQGTVSCVRRQSLGGDFSSFPPTTVNQAAKFGADFKPASVTILGYAGAPVQLLTQYGVGAEQSFDFTLGTKTGRLVARVQEASFEARRMRIVVGLTYNSTFGALTETGTGTQTTLATVDADGNLVYDSSVEYHVRLSANGPTFNAVEITDCDGTLTRQASR